MTGKTQVFLRNGGQDEWIVADENLETVHGKIVSATQNESGCIWVRDLLGDVVIMLSAIEQLRRTP